MIKNLKNKKQINITNIFCNEKLILQLSTVKKEIYLNIWSGNHPFYTGSKKIIDSENKIKNFEKKYNNLIK